MKLLTSLLSLLLCLNMTTYAQEKVVKFKHIDFKELAYSQILDIYQDENDFMWIGCYNGLFKMNPYGLKSFVPIEGDSTSISSSSASVVAGDSKGGLWVGTRNGLNYFNPGTEKFERFYPGDLLANGISNDVRGLCIYQGVLWVGTTGGLVKMDLATRTLELVKQAAIGGRVINELFLASDEKIWIASEDVGVCSLNPNTGEFRPYQFGSETTTAHKTQTANSFFEDAKGDLYVGTWEFGLQKLDREIQAFVSPVMDARTAELIRSGTVRTIEQKDSTHLWIGTFYSGLLLYDINTGSSVQHIPTKKHRSDQLNSAMIWTLFTDRTENLWVGTFGGGINIYDARQHTFPHYQAIDRPTNSFISNQIVSLASDAENVWLGAGGQGISKWNISSGTVSNYLHHEDERDGYIRKIYHTSIGQVWIGTENGIVLYNPASDQMVPVVSVVDESEPAMWPCYDISEDSSGNIWIGFYGHGTYKISKDLLQNPPSTIQLKKYDTGQRSISPVKHTTYLLHGDRSNHMWMLLDTHLGKLDLSNDSLHRYTDMGYSCIHEDAQNRIWLGTYSLGLFMYDAKLDSVRNIPIDGLPSSITGLQSDSLNRLWIYTFEGVYKYTPKTEELIKFTVLDGLQSDYIHYKAHAELPNGDIVIGGENGINIYNPYTIKEKLLEPKVTLTDFRIFNQSVTLDNSTVEDALFKASISTMDQVELAHAQNVISFDFAALNFSAPEQERYAYKLEGFDKEYRTMAGGMRSATYTNLDPGTYTLLYKATDSRGNWLANPNELKIIIHPPFWMTWWFKVLVGLILAGIAYWVYNLRMARVRRKFEVQQIEQEKAIVKLRNDKLRQELEHKNTELTSATMGVIRRNNTIQQIQNRLAELTEKLPDSHQGRFKLFLRQLNKEKKDEMSWDEFVRSFDATHNDFIKRFQDAYPDLTQKDLKLCAYLRMNLSNHDISSLLNVSLRSVETTRYRIRQKMDLQSKITLSEYIIKF